MNDVTGRKRMDVFTSPVFIIDDGIGSHLHACAEMRGPLAGFVIVICRASKLILLLTIGGDRDTAWICIFMKYILSSLRMPMPFHQSCHDIHSLIGIDSILKQRLD